MTLQIKTKYLAADKWQYRLEDPETGQKISLADLPEMADEDVLALAQSKLDAEADTMVGEVAQVDLSSVSDDDLLAEVSKRETITPDLLSVAMDMKQAAIDSKVKLGGVGQ
jgi:hypothetical protein